jgi:DNA transformation protein
MQVATLQNIGPKSAQWLADCGIFTQADLAHLGSVIAYRIVKDAGYPASLNLLYALEAALRSIDWRELDKSEKERLRREAGE